MKDLKVFFEDLATNESLAKKFEGIKKSADIVALAKEEGYEFTKKEYDNAMLEMVSGGGDIFGAIKQGAKNAASAAWNAGKDAVMSQFGQSSQQSGLAWQDGNDGYWYATDPQSGTQLAYNPSSGVRYVMSTSGWVQY